MAFQNRKSRDRLVFYFGNVGFLACCMRGARPAPLFQDLGWALPRSSVFVFGFGKPACERLSLGRCSSFGRWRAHTPGHVSVPRWKLARWQLVWRPLRTVEPPKGSSAADVLLCRSYKELQLGGRCSLLAWWSGNKKKKKKTPLNKVTQLALKLQFPRVLRQSDDLYIYRYFFLIFSI